MKELSASMRDTLRLLRNKVAQLKLDYTYKSSAYVKAYAVLSEINSIVNASHYDTASMDIPAIARVLNTWNEQDQTAYQQWNIDRQTLRRVQREANKTEKAKAS